MKNLKRILSSALIAVLFSSTALAQTPMGVGDGTPVGSFFTQLDADTIGPGIANMNLGNALNPFGDIHAGPLYITGVELSGDIDMNGNNITTDTDGNSRLDFGTNDQMKLYLGGNLSWNITPLVIAGATAGSGIVVNEAATATNPVHAFSGEPTSGLGLAGAGAITLVANEVELMRLDESSTPDLITVNAAMAPASDDGAALGVIDTKEWSDLFLATGGLISWDNGDITLAHGTNTLTFGGGYFIMNGPLVEKQGADIASANDLTIGADGDSWEITGTTPVQRISTAGRQNGDIITLWFTTGAADMVVDGVASGGGFTTLTLDGSDHYSPNAGDGISLQLKEIGGTSEWTSIGLHDVN